MKHGAEYLTSKTKRRLDVIGGSAIAATILPATVAVGVLASIDTHSINPFFLQERVGGNESPFMALKFRTIAKKAMSEVSYGTFDPRATKLGQVIRQTGLDELPQIYNVIQGSMSLVGARPMVESDIDYMEFAAPQLFEEWHAYYRVSKPGLAGASQVYRHHFRDGRSKAIYKKSAELDLQYFDQASLATDLRVLARTPIDMIWANVGVVDNLQAAPQEMPTA